MFLHATLLFLLSFLLLPFLFCNNAQAVAPQIAAGGRHTIALKSDGTLWAWGAGYSSAPVQIETDNKWVSIAAGYYHTIVLKSDGTLWAWGWNVYGQLGDGTNTDIWSPVQIMMVGVPQQYTLTVTKAGTGSGTVTSNPAGINCGADCNEVYNEGTAVTLTATPEAGSTFAGWSGDTSDGQVKMDADKNCTATFNLTPVNRPDLVVTLVDGPPFARGGERISITYRVMNQGSANARVNGIRFYLSKDTSITTGDLIIGNIGVPPLTPGASFTQTTRHNIIWRGLAGNYYIGAIVDFRNIITESNEGNNTGYDATPIFIVP